MRIAKISVEYTGYDITDLDPKLIVLFNRVSASIKQSTSTSGRTVQSDYIHQLARLCNRLGLNRDQVISWAANRFYRDNLATDVIAIIIYYVYSEHTEEFGKDNAKLVQFL